jgi:hypothetical protein
MTETVFEGEAAEKLLPFVGKSFWIGTEERDRKTVVVMEAEE